ncbi:Por secretion system C-terminal sorting domain-containing protein [Dyadobacter koreensis]|uniref:Por secretion system C-terminal sorting domain-containing protein n=1 Tax=Dyadobacter koreensis TaxID=408657 RepID=A0A1H6XKZ5_9BACT|nr:CotH kinase family protein [Dyadobacter koreensis]SEJ29758.1 Por secretion system C-terminal sorting domain-containing protein [Dyadobacter koreensis]
MGKFLALAVSFFLLSVFPNLVKAQEVLFINEVLASNKNGATDNTGSKEDWIEIYNPNNYQIDLGGYYLSDKPLEPTLFQIPTGATSPKIPAKGYIIFWASNKIERGIMHTNFGLSASGETLRLSSPQQQQIDVITFGAQTDDVSYGRKPDGSATFAFFSTPSHATSNNNAPVVLPKLSVPIFSQTAGFKNAAFDLVITNTEPGVRIRYTLDGSEPQDDANTRDFKYKNRYNDNGTHPDVGGVGEGWSLETYKTNLYESPIRIDDRTSASNKISRKTSSITYNPDYLPTEKIYKGTVIRAKAFKEGFTPSETVTRTFFINPSGATRYAVPVVAVTAPETSFFDYNTGIYTPGITFDQFRRDNPGLPAGFCTVGNFTNSGDVWERPGTIEFFNNNNLILSQEFGFRIHGGCSRSVPQKTLRLYSNTEFNFAVFPEAPTRFPKRLLLRNSGNDNNSTLFRDSYFQKLVGNLSFDTQLSRPAVVFLNSEYWGIQNITERYDKYYLEKKYGVNRDNVDLIDVEGIEVEEGDAVKYNELMAFVNNNSLANSTNYAAIKTMIDLENFTDYQIVEIFSANTDWPHKNTRLWRNKVAYNPAGNVAYGLDGRWRWMLYDTDIALGLNIGASVNSIPNARNGGAPSAILNKLLDNPDYKTYFINRVADLLNSTFLPSRSIPLLTATKAIYEPLIAEHLARWKSPVNKAFWEQSISEIASFLNDRGSNLQNHIRASLGSSYNNFALTINVSDFNRGYAKVNTMDILPTTDGIASSPYPWTGNYFQNNAIKLTAVSKTGSHFERWEKSGISYATTPEILLTSTTSAMEFKAIFADGPLPVTLRSFEAKRADNKVIVTWETTSEVNNDYFEVEKSADTRNWTLLATVKGAATTKVLQEYRTADEQPFPTLNYYRLKQVDFDRTTTYSRIVSVDMGNFQINKMWPNPVADLLNISLDQSVESGEYEITDINGRLIRRRQKLPETSVLTIPVGNLATGIYLIKIKTKDGVNHSSRFVKQ